MSRTKIFIFLLLLGAIGAGFYYVPRTRPFESYTQRAVEAFQLKEFEHSIELYLKALKFYPGHPRTPEVLLTIGDIYNFSLGNSEQATKAYVMLETRFPKAPEASKAYQHAGEMYEKNEQFENALLAYQGLVDYFPDLEGIDEARFKVAMMAVKLKKFEPARRSLMAIVDKNPDTPVADKVLYQLGNIFFMEGSSKEAIEVLKVASEKYKDSPLFTEMQFTMANAYEEMGQIENAMKIYKTIRYTYPNPRVVEKKIEKLNDRYKETKMFEQKALEAAKRDNQVKGIPSPESQKSIKANFIRRKKDSALDKSLMELMEGEP